jgi:hypothetical protein
LTSSEALTIVVPTRDDPESCKELLIALMVQNVHLALPLRVVFLANDTMECHTDLLQQLVSSNCFVSLQPRLLRARQNFLTCEESILDTLAANMDAVDDHFVIVGNTDRVVLAALPGALEYIRAHKLDLLLVGVMNREVHLGKIIRQVYMTPRHLNPKNRLGAANCVGPAIFSDAMSDYGPEAYTGYLGCQIYTRRFFCELRPIVAAMPEPLWAIALGTLELTTQKHWRVGYTPEVVTMRVDHLLYGPNSGEHPPDWWPIRSRMRRGFSKHLTLTWITNSLRLSSGAFQILVNAQVVISPRGSYRYIFSNFLYRFVEQVRDLTRLSFQDRGYRYSASELQDVVSFGKRLRDVEIGLPAEQHAFVSTWLEHFAMIKDYSNLRAINDFIQGADTVLMLLDRRPGMERWFAHLQLSPSTDPPV